MADVTVKQFAEVVGISVDRLLTQLKEAGVPVNDPDATINDSEKMELLSFLRNKHSVEKETETTKTPKKITLSRKTTSELKQTGGGKSKSVTVEVRKKRTYVKRSVAMETESEEVEKARLEREKLAAEQRQREDDEKRRQEEQEAKRQAEIEAEREKERRQEEEKHPIFIWNGAFFF